MTTQVLFVQGAGQGAHDEDELLVRSLQRELGPDFEVIYPVMPDEDSPDDEEWERKLADEVTTIREGGILAGHSAGAASLIRFVADHKLDREIAGVFLMAAPFIGPGGWEMDGLNLPPDLSRRLPDGMPVFLYHGKEDEVVPFTHLSLYRKALPAATARALSGRNHQLNNDLSLVAADMKRVA